MAKMRYVFCENVWATSSSPWHIRVTKEVKPGGTNDLYTLCGRDFANGWDLEVDIFKYISDGRVTDLSHVCGACLKEYRHVLR